MLIVRLLQANTELFHRKFTMLTTQGACGINLLPNYWKDRSNAEIPSLALNAFALLVSAFLSWRLMKVSNHGECASLCCGMLIFFLSDIRMADFQACGRVPHDQQGLQPCLDVLHRDPALALLRRRICSSLD